MTNEILFTWKAGRWILEATASIIMFATFPKCRLLYERILAVTGSNLNNLKLQVQQGHHNTNTACMHLPCTWSGQCCHVTHVEVTQTVLSSASWTSHVSKLHMLLQHLAQNINWFAIYEHRTVKRKKTCNVMFTKQVTMSPKSDRYINWT